MFKNFKSIVFDFKFKIAWKLPLNFSILQLPCVAASLCLVTSFLAVPFVFQSPVDRLGFLHPLQSDCGNKHISISIFYIRWHNMDLQFTFDSFLSLLPSASVRFFFISECSLSRLSARRFRFSLNDAGYGFRPSRSLRRGGE